MRVRVRLFAAARQSVGRDSVDVALPEGATIAELRRQLGSRFPQLSGWLAHVTFALDAQYADDQATIPPEADVACIPPVSGG